MDMSKGPSGSHHLCQRYIYGVKLLGSVVHIYRAYTATKEQARPFDIVDVGRCLPLSSLEIINLPLVAHFPRSGTSPARIVTTS